MTYKIYLSSDQAFDAQVALIDRLHVLRARRHTAIAASKPNDVHDTTSLDAAILKSLLTLKTIRNHMHNKPLDISSYDHKVSEPPVKNDTRMPIVSYDLKLSDCQMNIIMDGLYTQIASINRLLRDGGLTDEKYIQDLKNSLVAVKESRDALQYQMRKA